MDFNNFNKLYDCLFLDFLLVENKFLKNKLNLNINSLNNFTQEDPNLINYITNENDNLKNEIFKVSDYSSDNLKYSTVTFLIYFHEVNALDEKKLIWLLNYFLEIGVKNIIISEENISQKTEYLYDIFKDKFNSFCIVFNKTDVFNKARAINNVLQMINTPFFFICDINIFLDKKSYDQCLTLVSKGYDFIVPKSNGLNEIILEDDFDNNFSYKNYEISEKFNTLHENLILCKKESFLEIGGFNSYFESDVNMHKELLIRINLSNFNIISLDSSSFCFNFNECDNIKIINEDLLIKSYYLSKLNDFNVLISENEELFNNYYANLRNDFDFTEENYKISIIMPIYNAQEFYLKRSIYSLMNQTFGFENIELILIDDGSNYSESKNLIKYFSNNYPNIKSIYLDVNSGAGIARNIGIKFATSDFIIFLDHDDYLIKDSCERLYNLISSNDVDIVISNYINLNRGLGKKIDWNKYNLNHIELIGNYKENMDIFRLDPAISTKIFSKKFILDNNIWFKSYKTAQDNLFNRTALFNANGILLVDEPSYIYNVRRGNSEDLSSVSVNISKDKIISSLNSHNDSLILFKNFAPDYLFLPLNSLNFMIRSRILKSDLSFVEFKSVVDTANYLSVNYMNNIDKLSNNYIDLINCFAFKEYEKGYELYQKLKNI